MSVIKVLRDLDGLFNYSTDENPTSQQDYQEAVKNWVKTIVSLVDAVMWQPETEYTVGSQLLTPSLPYYVLRCTVAGTSGAAEPDYTDVALGDEITDGTVTWVVDGYLPLSGGTMSGDIEFYDNLYLGSPLESDSNQKTKYAGLYSNKNNPHKYCSISFINQQTGNIRPQTNIIAGDGTNRNFLTVYGDAAGGVTYKGIDISIAAMGTNYIRYNNGIQICWGSNNGSDIPQTITYPVPFTEFPAIGIQSGDFMASNWQFEGFQLLMAPGHTKPSTVYFKYIAIGRWK